MERKRSKVGVKDSLTVWDLVTKWALFEEKHPVGYMVKKRKVGWYCPVRGWKPKVRRPE